MKRLLLFLIIGFVPSLYSIAQKEHFKLLGQWSIEGEEFGLTPYCFEITMDKYGKMYAKVPASYSIRKKVVTGWQNTSVYAHSDKSGYYFESVNTRRESSYGVNFQTPSGSNEYKSICTLINYDVGDEVLTAWIAEIYGVYLDKVREIGDVTFIKVGDVEMPQLVDNKQTRKKGDAGKIGEAVDLGLSVKWASWNVGSSKPEEYGGYYAWGETEEKDIYNWKTYKYVRNDIDGDYWNEDTVPHVIVHKYQRIGKEIDGDEVNISICGTAYDVAHSKWGGDWRMPSKAEIEELESKCKKEHTSLNGVEGWYFIGPNGNRIFLPSAGVADEDGVSWDMLDWRGAACMYWSGDLITHYYLLGVQFQMADGSQAWSISFDNRGVQFGDFSSRCDGLQVRPVTK